MNNETDQSDERIRNALDAIPPDPTAPARMMAALTRRRSRDMLSPVWWTAGAGLAGFALAYFGQGSVTDSTATLADGTFLLFGGLQ